MSNYLSNITHKHFGRSEKLHPRLPGWFEPGPIATQPSGAIGISPFDQLEVRATGLEPQQGEPIPQFDNTQPSSVSSLTRPEMLSVPSHNPGTPRSIFTTHPTAPALSSPHINSPPASISLEHSIPASEPTQIPSPSSPINKEVVVKGTVLEKETVIKPEINRSSYPPKIVTEQQGSLRLAISKSQKDRLDAALEPLPHLTKPMPIPSHLTPVLSKKPTQEPVPANPAPTIQVSIGRIEVRATSPAATPKPKKRTIPPVMSLDDYLRQHRGGSDR